MRGDQALLCEGNGVGQTCGAVRGATLKLSPSICPQERFLIITPFLYAFKNSLGLLKYITARVPVSGAS